MRSNAQTHCVLSWHVFCNVSIATACPCIRKHLRKLQSMVLAVTVIHAPLRRIRVAELQLRKRELRSARRRARAGGH